MESIRPMDNKDSYGGKVLLTGDGSAVLIELHGALPSFFVEGRFGNGSKN